MIKIGVFFAAGYEEVEALTVVDICRRAGIGVQMISIDNEKSVTGSHGVGFLMDQGIDETNFGELSMLVLPGGMPGTKNLEGCGKLMEQLDRFYENGKEIAAICAAPTIFGHRGYLKGRKAACYPGMEDQLTGAKVSYEPAVSDGNVTCGRGMGCAIPFALRIVEKLVGRAKAEELAGSIVYGK